MACEHITKNMPKDRSEIIIRTLVDMSKKGLWNDDYSKDIIAEINPIMEKTMNCRVNENGGIVPVSLLMDEEKTKLN